MWYAVLVVVTLATGGVDAYVADQSFDTERACKEFTASHEADFTAHVRDFAFAQTCIKPVGGQDL